VALSHLPRERSRAGRGQLLRGQEKVKSRKRKKKGSKEEKGVRKKKRKKKGSELNIVMC
jgi:hypothetical protein